jgi:nicotinamidase-related amidase
MKLIDVNGKKTAIINVFIDPENGFMLPTLTDADGGVLYVPGGEVVPPLMGQVIDQSEGTIFIIGQDYHPRNHISFMDNHPGVMEYRIEQFKQFLLENHQPVPTDYDELYTACQQPVHFFDGFDNPPAEFPFPEIVLDDHKNIIGLKEADGCIRKVDVETTSGLEPSKEDRGRVTKVADEYWPNTFDEYVADGHLLSTQTLWTVHCVQGSKSCLYPDELNLPQGLIEKLEGDYMRPAIYHRDADSDNEFWVVRKGIDSEVDSYGIGVENDGETETIARQVFFDLAKKLKSMGCEQVVINTGGLATNFCTEFSANNIDDFLAGHFKQRGMGVTLNYVPEISRGIPIPGGPDVPFSLEGTEGRLKRRGIMPVGLQHVVDLSSRSALKASLTSGAAQVFRPGQP